MNTVLNRQQVIDRLKAGWSLRESGNTLIFRDGKSVHPSTAMHLVDGGLVEAIQPRYPRIYTWVK